MTETETTQLEPDPVEADSFAALAARLAGVNQRRYTRNRVVFWLTILPTLIAIVALGASLGDASFIPIMVAIIAIGATGGIVWWRGENHYRRQMQRVAEWQDVRAVAPLLSGLNFQHGPTARKVEAALLRLLPTLTEEDAPVIPAEERHQLNGLLYHRNAELAWAALSALVHVGDGVALPYLTSMAAGKGMPGPLRRRKAEAQQLALRAKAAIQDRIERQNRSSVLLRASAAPAASPAELVRPASGTQVDTSTLLRPDSMDESGTAGTV